MERMRNDYNVKDFEKGNLKALHKLTGFEDNLACLV